MNLFWQVPLATVLFFLTAGFLYLAVLNIETFAGVAMVFAMVILFIVGCICAVKSYREENA